MKIAVIAANGRSGRVFVQKALAAGHSVKAGIYKTNDLLSHPLLTIIECDATKEDDLLQLIDGQDAVVSFIGHVKGSPAHVQTDAMVALNSAMQRKNVRRFVSLTGTGVRFSGDKITLVDRFLNGGVSVVDPARIQDGRDYVELLRQSDLDWTLLRVLKLQNTKPSPFVLKVNGPTKWFVSREEVADATLQVLEDETFIKEAPILSKP